MTRSKGAVLENVIDDDRTKLFVDRLIIKTLSNELKWDYGLCRTLIVILSKETSITVAPDEMYIGIYLKGNDRTQINVRPTGPDMDRLVSAILESKGMSPEIEKWLEDFLKLQETPRFNLKNYLKGWLKM